MKQFYRRSIILLMILFTGYQIACSDHGKGNKNRSNDGESTADDSAEKDSSEPGDDAAEHNDGLENFKRSAAYPSFLDYCEDAASEDGVKVTVKALKEAVSEDDCKKADEKLLKKAGLFLQSKGISDLRPLAGFPNLQKLSVRNNNVKDLTPLSELKELEYLAISRNKVEDISPLANSPKLTILLMTNNPIIDADAIRSMPSLSYVWHGDGEGTVEKVGTKFSKAVKKLQWRYGEGICFGGWFYDAYKNCRHESHGVESYLSKRSAQCGVERVDRNPKTCRHEGNGVESWNSETRERKLELKGAARRVRERIRQRLGLGWIFRFVEKTIVDPIPDFRHRPDQMIRDCVNWSIRHRGPKLQVSVDHRFLHRDPLHLQLLCLVTVKTPKLYKNAPNPACGWNENTIYKECRAKSHGVEFYKEAISKECGTSTQTKLSGLKTSATSVGNALGAPLSCSSCDEIDISTPDDRLKKLSCLKGTLQRREKDVSQDAKGTLEDLLYAKTDQLSETQVEFIQENISN